MDWMNIREQMTGFIKKYKYPILVLAAGLFLMSLPEGRQTQEELTVPEVKLQESGVAESLEQILTQIDGVGKVRVMLTEEKGRQTLYQTDSDKQSSDNSESIRIETVLVSDADRTQSPLILQENPPVYRGAIIVCQGADRPSVQLAVVEAVANVTGISADRITVLKMK